MADMKQVARNALLSRYKNGPRPAGPQVCLRCPEAEATRLRAYARRERLAVSEALRRIIDKALPDDPGGK